MFFYLHIRTFLVPSKVRSYIFRIAVQSSKPINTRKTSVVPSLFGGQLFCAQADLFSDNRSPRNAGTTHFTSIEDGFWSPRWFRIAALEPLQQIF